MGEVAFSWSRGSPRVRVGFALGGSCEMGSTGVGVGMGKLAWTGDSQSRPYGIRWCWGWDLGAGDSQSRPDGIRWCWGWDLRGRGRVTEYGRGPRRPYGFRWCWGWDLWAWASHRVGFGGPSRLQDLRLLGLGYGSGRASRWLAPTDFDGWCWSWDLGAGESQSRPYGIRWCWGWDLGAGEPGSPLRISRWVVLGLGFGAGEPRLAPTVVRRLRLGWWPSGRRFCR